MATNRKSEPEHKATLRRPATTPDGREQQLVSMAYDAAEDRIKNGVASAQEIVHFLKLGSSRERLEQERLTHENNLLQVKADAMASAKETEEMYRQALDAMREYSGRDPLPRDDIYED